jgi:AcrR family transcriptional regulator
MKYSEPKQSRSYQTEQRFLDTLAGLLSLKSFHQTTVADIAEAAGMTSGSFMTRFGSKRGALVRLFERFCTDVSKTLDQVSAEPFASMSLDKLCVIFSSRYEALVRAHWGSNHAMHEIFLLEGEIDEQTKTIFKATTATLASALAHRGVSDADMSSVFAAVQLLVTLNYNYVLGAMPGLPKEDESRHQLIAKLMIQALDLKVSDNNRFA